MCSVRTPRMAGETQHNKRTTPRIANQYGNHKHCKEFPHAATPRAPHTSHLSSAIGVGGGTPTVLTHSLQICTVHILLLCSFQVPRRALRHDAPRRAATRIHTASRCCQGKPQAPPRRRIKDPPPPPAPPSIPVQCNRPPRSLSVLYLAPHPASPRPAPLLPPPLTHLCSAPSLCIATTLTPSHL